MMPKENPKEHGKLIDHGNLNVHQQLFQSSIWEEIPTLILDSWQLCRRVFRILGILKIILGEKSNTKKW